LKDFVHIHSHPEKQTELNLRNRSVQKSSYANNGEPVPQVSKTNEKKSWETTLTKIFYGIVSLVVITILWAAAKDVIIPQFINLL